MVLSAALDLAAGELGVGLESNVFPTGEDVSLEDTKVRLAGMLPGLARWSKLAITGLPNELVDVSAALFYFQNGSADVLHMNSDLETFRK